MEGFDDLRPDTREQLPPDLEHIHDVARDVNQRHDKL